MPNMTLSIPEDVYKIIKTHKEVRWSEIARRAIEDYAKKIALLNAMTAKSDLTEDDIMTLDTKVKSGIQQHYKNKASRNTSRKPDSP
jgi:predicted CopG family antitoxin